MLLSARICGLLLLINVLYVCGKELNRTTISQKSCVFYYEKGVEAYLDNDYGACAINFEIAVEKYRDYMKKLQHCRLSCREEADLSEPLYPVNIDDLLFYERAVKNTLCIVKCKRKYKSALAGVYINKQIEKLFEKRKPYEYLHICYFQNKEYQKAASAAYTFLVTNPDDVTMLDNLKHYSSLEGVEMTEVVNFEAKDYVYLYIHGADAYGRKDWNEVVQNMEESLLAFLQAEEECRAQCEGPFDQGWYPDFLPAIANHFTYCLRCKTGCKNKLNSLNGEKHDDLLPSHYHYLQYAYFKLGKLKEACAAVASYLLYYPNDETMLKNMEYYSEMPRAKDRDLFIPRKEAVHYIQRQIYEQRLLKFIFREFTFDNVKEQEEANKGQSSAVDTDNTA